ncbi:hypothetical protein V9K67_03965, partial [Paraflavisolibacter sp. H34]|uniref:hypothetical protein n=1 Tax=Huijunlia imazamoxiresistens TaxID=3127457 RepID=UPI0030183863
MKKAFLLFSLWTGLLANEATAQAQPDNIVSGSRTGTFAAGNKEFVLNGKPFVIRAAELHYPRIPREY